MFIAPKISEGALAHFFNLNRMNTRAYGGKTRIIPMSIKQFILFITIAKDKDFKDPDVLQQYLESILKMNLKLEDETYWYEHIHGSVSNWVV